MTGDAQRVMATVHDLVRPREDAAMWEYCTEQGVWKPNDLDLLDGLEDGTLIMGPHTGYESQVVVFYALFLYAYALFPCEPCTDTPHQGEPDPGPYPGLKEAASARVVGRCYVAVYREEGRWKLASHFTTYDLKAWMRDSGARGLGHLRGLENIPVAPERASEILFCWGLDYDPAAGPRGPGEGRVHWYSGGGTVDTTGIRPGVFVRHLFKAREGGTWKPRTYALGVDVPRLAELCSSRGNRGPTLRGPSLP